MSDRAEFEKWFKDNHERPGETVNLQMRTDMWAGWQAARAQGGQGADLCRCIGSGNGCCCDRCDEKAGGEK